MQQESHQKQGFIIERRNEMVQCQFTINSLE